MKGVEMSSAILINERGDLLFSDSADLAHWRKDDSTYRIAWRIGDNARRLEKAFNLFLANIGVTEEEFGIDVVYVEIFKAGIAFAEREASRKARLK